MNKLFGSLGLGSTCNVQLTFDGNHPKTKIRGYRGAIDEVPVFHDKETVHGTVTVSPIPGKRFEHQGIRVQLVGDVELITERGNRQDFLSLVRELAPGGDLLSSQTFHFEFKSVEMEQDSYRGNVSRLGYKLRVVISRSFGGSIVRDYPFWVRNVTPPESLPDDLSISQPIKMEVGIEDCLHIEFEFDKGAYHLTDTVLGKIYFLLVRIKLKHMEVELRRRETTGSGPSARVETDTVAKFEVMDGAPVRGEVIPIRMHLAPYELTPSYSNVHNKFSVKYLLNLVLVDEEDRRYFKQQEIRLYRTPEDNEEEKDEHGSSHEAGSSRNNGSSRVMTPRTAGRILSGNPEPLPTPPQSSKHEHFNESTEIENTSSNDPNGAAALNDTKETPL